ncbi:OmpW family outer membrane protein [Salinisphaera sp. G21_0]|uniref:OmpW/AlkL family protein n=1 Tax=Salinisphaera sp. G21_0 TaxID=2821094 RepID=UPI001ADC91DA|nr:OmpW family outer membrane protein [Salinisphaera sp. G21_0]MBO9479935.1 outer membrane beta-barrel protein [Salinisphaera sp. G21_0]
MKIKSLSLAIISAAVLLSGAAQGYEAGDIIVRGGLASVNPDVDSGNLNVNGFPLSQNAKVDVNNETQLGLSLTYMVRDNIGVELLAATPISHKLQGKGDLSFLSDFAEVKHLPPTLSVQYYPMGNASAFQPYFGAGLNYTIFFSEQFVGAGSDAGFRNLKLDDSLGLAAQIGFDYLVADNWSVNAAVWYMDIDTTGTFKDGSNNDYKIDVSLDPWVYMAGVAYLF